MEPGAQSMLRGQRSDLGNIVGSAGKIPQYVQRERRAHACPAVDLPRVAEFLFDRDGRRRLQELAEARSGVGETPGRQFDAKGVQRLTEGIALALFVHGVTVIETQ